MWYKPWSNHGPFVLKLADEAFNSKVKGYIITFCRFVPFEGLFGGRFSHELGRNLVEKWFKSYGEKEKPPRSKHVYTQTVKRLFIYLFIFVNGGNEITRKYPNKEETDRTWNTMQQKKIKERRFVFLKEERRFV